MDEGPEITMFPESNGDWLKSQYAVSLSVSLTNRGLTWQALRSQLLQEYSSLD